MFSINTGQINQSLRAELHKEGRVQAMKLLLIAPIISVDITAIRKDKNRRIVYILPSVQNPCKLGCTGWENMKAPKINQISAIINEETVGTIPTGRTEETAFSELLPKSQLSVQAMPEDRLGDVQVAAQTLREMHLHNDFIMYWKYQGVSRILHSNLKNGYLWSKVYSKPQLLFLFIFTLKQIR